MTSHYSIASIIVKNIPIIPPGISVQLAQKYILKNIKKFETIDYIYAVTKTNKLKGVFSIKELFVAPKKAKISKLFPSDIVQAKLHTHKQRIALLALKHNIKAVPIVSKDGDFLGIIDFDDILKILDEEALEDLLKITGTTGNSTIKTFDDISKLSIYTALKHRLPWLIIGLIGGGLTAGIISQFEETLARNLIIVNFIPLIVYMADAIGTQMEAFVIRDSYIINNFNFFKYFIRQFYVVLSLATILSAGLFILLNTIYKNTLIGITVGIALFVAILSSIFTGLVIPLFFQKLKLDPANASGPIATILQDVLSIFIYFSIANLLL